MQRILFVLGVVLLAGCSSMPKPAQVDFVEAAHAPMPSAAPRPVTGGLFQSTTYRPGFQDVRARQVGDLLTVRIVENVTASQKTSLATNRTSSISGSITAVPGFTFPATTAENGLRIGGSSTADFSGKGDNEAANTFSGNITATVVQVLPNGHLVVVGEKQIGLNHNVDVLRFTGTVDPLQILPGNLVNSSQVADVRVESKGRGPQHEAQTVGWLTRFFYNISPF